MFYKLKNIVCAYVFVAALLLSGNVFAQGVVTLSEEAMFDDDEADVIPVVSEQAAPENDIDVVQPKITTAELHSLAAENTEQDQLAENTDLDYILNNGAEETSSEVFSRMSNIEKQTALLNLELRKEKVKNEIEAIKNQRKQAIVQEKEKAEEKRRKQIEWEKDQEQKVLKEQQELRSLDIEFEKIRQEKLLNAYKNDMLKTNQEWIKHNGSLHKQIRDLKEQKKQIQEEAKNKIADLKSNIETVSAQIPELIDSFKKELKNKETQISLLKSRIEAQNKEFEREKSQYIKQLEDKQNPFADGDSGDEDEYIVDTAEMPVEKIADLYAVMEIRGQKGELIAKLINKEGVPFYVKKGTKLQSGHRIEEITSTYVKVEKNDFNDYLYFAAGGILPQELPKSTISSTKDQATSNQKITPKAPAPAPAPAPAKSKNKSKSNEFATSVGIPGLGNSMMAR